MTPLYRTGGILVFAVVLLSSMPGAPRADDGAVQNQISVYTGANAQGYLQPLANAFGAALNSTFGYSAYIPNTSFHISFEAPVMGVFFEDADRTFSATSESGFVPDHHASTTPRPWWVPAQAVTVTGQGGAQFSVSGRTRSQLVRAGGSAAARSRRWQEPRRSCAGWRTNPATPTSARSACSASAARHSLSQYMGATPVARPRGRLDVADLRRGREQPGRRLYVHQRLLPAGAGEQTHAGGLHDVRAVHGDRRTRASTSTLPTMTPTAIPSNVSLEGENDIRFTVGAGFNFVVGQLLADYSFANTNNFSFGLALGNVGRPQ